MDPSLGSMDLFFVITRPSFNIGSRSIQIIKMGENRSSEFIRKLAKRAGNITEKAKAHDMT
ncbi:hypothetical protein F2Q70_00044437 [Brassica cretica]|uniref:Uncharacterized protein n=1 Tax=Brassica cretica TaxID=69181 RepID=A0A3N6PXV5_BRACR|nr:hypothetical protein F2Q70_00044437 [Brassica cretica]KAF3516467.1 hypothetical protein DY000_02062235 [Brassica cretica]